MTLGSNLGSGSKVHVKGVWEPEFLDLDHDTLKLRVGLHYGQRPKKTLNSSDPISQEIFYGPNEFIIKFGFKDSTKTKYTKYYI